MTTFDPVWPKETVENVEIETTFGGHCFEASVEGWVELSGLKHSQITTIWSRRAFAQSFGHLCKGFLRASAKNALRGLMGGIFGWNYVAILLGTTVSKILGVVFKAESQEAQTNISQWNIPLVQFK